MLIFHLNSGIYVDKYIERSEELRGISKNYQTKAENYFFLTLSEDYLTECFGFSQQSETYLM